MNVGCLTVGVREETRVRRGGVGGVMKKIENAGKLEKRSWCDFRLKLTSKKRRKISGKLAI